MPLAAGAQPPGKMPRIGVRSGGTPATYAARHEAFRQALRELGSVEGKDIVQERLPSLAAELVRLNVDLILTYGEPQIHAAKQATQTIRTSPRCYAAPPRASTESSKAPSREICPSSSQ
jgi:putative tryptophan/tyrosine transport system substrate-binding protein